MFLALRTFRDGTLLAEIYGFGPPRVLALHGWGRRGSDFAQALQGISAIAPDLPGFGATPAPSRSMGAEDLANIVVDLLDEFDDPPVVVGHSFGGRIAVCLAAAHPRRVDSLVLTGVPLLRKTPARKPPITYRMLRLANRAGLVSDRRMEEIRRARGSADYRAATGVMRDVLVTVVNESYEAQLGVIENPVVLLWGADDEEVPVAIAEEADRLLADSSLRIVPGVGHFLPTQAPETLNSVIRDLTT